MSPGFMAATAAVASFPMQSSAKATGRFRTSAIAGANSLSDCLGSCPLGRPKWESKMTLPPLSTNSMIVGAIRSIRVLSVTLPPTTGTLRSTRTSTRLFLISASSSVANALMLASPEDGTNNARVGKALCQKRTSTTLIFAVRDCRCLPWLKPCPEPSCARRFGTPLPLFQPTRK